MKSIFLILILLTSNFLFGQIIIDTFSRRSITFNDYSKLSYQGFLYNKPDTFRYLVSGLGASGGCMFVFTKELNYRKNGFKASFSKYGDKDTFYLEEITLYKNNSFTTIDGIHAKRKISLDVLKLEMSGYFESAVDRKKYGLITKNGIDYYVRYKPKNKVTTKTKFRVKWIVINGSLAKTK